MAELSVSRATLEYEQGMQQLCRAIQSEHGARNYFTGVRQKHVAKELHGVARSIEGLGAPALHIDTEVYAFYAARYGRKIWKDKTFLRWMRNKHPEVFVTGAKGTRIQSGYGGLAARCRKKFSKSYG